MLLREETLPRPISTISIPAISETTSLEAHLT